MRTWCTYLTHLGTRRDKREGDRALRFWRSFRIDSSRFGIIPSDLISPSCSATATEIVSAWTSKPTNFILFIDRLLRLWFWTACLPIRSITRACESEPVIPLYLKIQMDG